MKCIIATGKPKKKNDLTDAEIIIQKLQEMPEFADWEFEACTDAEDLYNLESQPEVIVFRHDLSKNQEKLFKNLPVSQPLSRLIFLAGFMSSKTNALIKMAQDYGINNIVTGELPGDKPYTLPIALKYDKDAIDKAIQEHTLAMPDESNI